MVHKEVRTRISKETRNIRNLNSTVIEGTKRLSPCISLMDGYAPLIEKFDTQIGTRERVEAFATSLIDPAYRTPRTVYTLAELQYHQSTLDFLSYFRSLDTIIEETTSTKIPEKARPMFEQVEEMAKQLPTVVGELISRDPFGNAPSEVLPFEKIASLGSMGLEEKDLLDEMFTTMEGTSNQHIKVFLIDIALAKENSLGKTYHAFYNRMLTSDAELDSATVNDVKETLVSRYNLPEDKTTELDRLVKNYFSGAKISQETEAFAEQLQLQMKKYFRMSCEILLKRYFREEMPNEGMIEPDSYMLSTALAVFFTQQEADLHPQMITNLFKSNFIPNLQPNVADVIENYYAKSFFEQKANILKLVNEKGEAAYELAYSTEIPGQKDLLEKFQKVSVPSLDAEETAKDFSTHFKTITDYVEGTLFTVNIDGSDMAMNITSHGKGKYLDIILIDNKEDSNKPPAILLQMDKTGRIFLPEDLQIDRALLKQQISKTILKTMGDELIIQKKPSIITRNITDLPDKPATSVAGLKQQPLLFKNAAAKREYFLTHPVAEVKRKASQMEQPKEFRVSPTPRTETSRQAEPYFNFEIVDKALVGLTGVQVGLVEKYLSRVQEEIRINGYSKRIKPLKIPDEYGVRLFRIDGDEIRIIFQQTDTHTGRVLNSAVRGNVYEKTAFNKLYGLVNHL